MMTLHPFETWVVLKNHSTSNIEIFPGVVETFLIQSNAAAQNLAIVRHKADAQLMASSPSMLKAFEFLFDCFAKKAAFPKDELDLDFYTSAMKLMLFEIKSAKGEI